MAALSALAMGNALGAMNLDTVAAVVGTGNSVPTFTRVEVQDDHNVWVDVKTELKDSNRELDVSIHNCYPGYQLRITYDVENVSGYPVRVDTSVEQPALGLEVTSEPPEGYIPAGSKGTGAFTVTVTDDALEETEYAFTVNLIFTYLGSSGGTSSTPFVPVVAGFTATRILLEGGTALSPGGRFEIIVPPGVLTEPITVGISSPPNISVPEVPNAILLDRDRNEVTYETDDGEMVDRLPGNVFARFTEPATAFRGCEPRFVHIKRWHQGLGLWIDLPVEVDLANNRVTGKTVSPGVYVLTYESNEDRTYANLYHHWACKEIAALASLDLGGDMKAWYSCADGVLDPDSAVTFEDYLELLFKAYDFGEWRDRQPSPRPPLYTGSVLDRAVEEGILSRQEAALIDLKGPIGRLRATLLATRLLRIPVSGKLAPFGDISGIARSAFGPLNAAAELGLVVGRLDDMFMPYEPMLRGEACALIWRMLEFMVR